MSDTAAWLARKLGLGQPPQGPQSAPVAPQQPQYAYPPPQGAPQQQGAPPSVMVDDHGRPIIHVMDAAAAWQGTKAAKADSGHCPECGSANYFLRASTMKRRVNNATPSPLCMDCGYNEIFDTQMGAGPVDQSAPVWEGR